jgi:peptide-methionine (S)-S-oxide reductase
MGILDFLVTDPAKLQLPSPADALPGRVEPILAPGRHAVLGTPIDGPWPAGTRTVVFALGCFWGAEKGFWSIPGVVTTAVGYAGGVTPNPTYEEVCSGRTDHAEVVRVAYDPERVSFE